MKKIFAIILSVMMVASLAIIASAETPLTATAPATTVASADFTTITATPDKTSVSAKGDKIVVNYVVSNNAGIMVLTMGRISTVVPTGLTLVDEKDGGLFGAPTTGANNVLYLMDADSKANGILYTATFEVAVDVKEGDTFTFSVPTIVAANYNEQAVQVNCVNATVSKAACTHANTEVRGKVNASCTQSGYTGDTYCKDCGKKIAEGTVIGQFLHTGGTATCTKKAVCTLCKQEYGNVNADNHPGTKVVNVKAATSTTEGYTGDTVCTDCGKTLKKGEAIAKIINPPTNDNSIVTIAVIAVLGIAAIAGAAVVYNKRREF